MLALAPSPTSLLRGPERFRQPGATGTTGGRCEASAPFRLCDDHQPVAVAIPNAEHRHRVAPDHLIHVERAPTSVCVAGARSIQACGRLRVELDAVDEGVDPAAIGLAAARFPGGPQAVQQAPGRRLGHSPVPHDYVEGGEVRSRRGGSDGGSTVPGQLWRARSGRRSPPIRFPRPRAAPPVRSTPSPPSRLGCGRACRPEPDRQGLVSLRHGRPDPSPTWRPEGACSAGSPIRPSAVTVDAPAAGLPSLKAAIRGSTAGTPIRARASAAYLRTRTTFEDGDQRLHGGGSHPAQCLRGGQANVAVRDFRVAIRGSTARGSPSGRGLARRTCERRGLRV